MSDDTKDEGGQVQDIVMVREAVAILAAEHGLNVKPDVITNGFLRDWFNGDACPVKGGRRLIPRDQMYPIAAELRRRGYGRKEA